MYTINNGIDYVTAITSMFSFFGNIIMISVFTPIGQSHNSLFYPSIIVITERILYRL